MTELARHLIISGDLYGALLSELARRGRGSREAGAFLLAPVSAPQTTRTVTDVVYYDDLDPASLTGAIDFGPNGYQALNDRCRSGHLQVVGDIHTHPSSIVRQSAIDAAHPMVALPAHIALIAPNYGAGSPPPDQLGAHLYLGGGKWKSFFGVEVATVLSMPPAARAGDPGNDARCRDHAP